MLKIEWSCTNLIGGAGSKNCILGRTLKILTTFSRTFFWTPIPFFQVLHTLLCFGNLTEKNLTPPPSKYFLNPGFNANLFQISLGNKMAETGWTRPKQSFKLKKNNSISGKPPPLRREVVNNGLYIKGGYVAHPHPPPPNECNLWFPSSFLVSGFWYFAPL